MNHAKKILFKFYIKWRHFYFFRLYFDAVRESIQSGILRSASRRRFSIFNSLLPNAKAEVVVAFDSRWNFIHGINHQIEEKREKVEQNRLNFKRTKCANLEKGWLTIGREEMQRQNHLLVWNLKLKTSCREFKIYIALLENHSKRFKYI